MTEWRKGAIKRSNNKQNPRKNVCLWACAEAFNCNDRVHYLHTLEDLLNALKRTKEWNIKRLSLKQFKSKTLRGLKTELNKKYSYIKNKEDRFLLIVAIKQKNDNVGHVLILTWHGETLADTWGQSTYLRKIYKVTAKEGVIK